jgi:hypothetical protein
MIDLMGWPVKDRLPAKFQLLWAKVNEPDKLLNQPGAIFMWVEALDKNNVPNGIPRAYRLPYTQPLETGIQNALDMITNGQEVGGTAQMYDEEEQRRGRDDQQLAQLQNVKLPDKEFIGGAN